MRSVSYCCLYIHRVCVHFAEALTKLFVHITQPQLHACVNAYKACPKHNLQTTDITQHSFRPVIARLRCPDSLDRFSWRTKASESRDTATGKDADVKGAWVFLGQRYRRS